MNEPGATGLSEMSDDIVGTLVGIGGRTMAEAAGTIIGLRSACGRLRAQRDELLEAARIVLAGLEARIDAAPSSSKPVFNGIADLHDAIKKTTGDVAE